MFKQIASTYVLDFKRLYIKNGRKKSQECGVPSFITRNLLFVSRPLKIKITHQFDFILAVCWFMRNINFVFDQNLCVVRYAGCVK